MLDRDWLNLQAGYRRAEAAVLRVQQLRAELAEATRAADAAYADYHVALRQLGERHETLNKILERDREFPENEMAGLDQPPVLRGIHLTE